MEVNDAIERLQAAAGNPEQLALATLDFVLSVHGADLSPVVEAAAIPHWFNTSVLAQMLSVDQTAAEAYVERLSKLPMVEAFPARSGWNVHEATRRAQRSQLRTDKAQRFLALSDLASKCFPGTGAHEKVETLFHTLIAQPAVGATELRFLHDTWLNAGKLENIQTLQHALAELVKYESPKGSAGARCKAYLASLSEGYLTVNQVEQLARDALQMLEGESDDLAEMDARDILGDALKDQSRFPEALTEYRRCGEIATRLMRENPDEPKWRREYSVTVNKIGSVYQGQELFDQALVEYKQYKAILEKLTGDHPTNLVWQRELAVACGYVGDLYMAQEKYTEALVEHQEYNTHMRQLAQVDPENARWQTDLAASCRSVGSAKQRLNHHSEALTDFQEYLSIIQNLVRRDPENAKLQIDLAYAHWWIAGTHDSQQMKDEALQEARLALQFLSKVTQADPGNQQWQKSLADLESYVSSLTPSLPPETSKLVN